MSFATPDSAIIARWGETATHIVGAVETDVKVIRADKGMEAAPTVLQVLFGTIKDSGFASVPVKNDVFRFDGELYRVYDVKSDRPGGTADTDGLWIHLTFDQ